MAYGEKGMSVLAKTLIIMILFIRQNLYSDMNNSLMKYEIGMKSVLND